MSEPSFLIEVEQAAAALKRLIDDLDADSLADLFSYAYGVEAVTYPYNDPRNFSSTFFSGVSR